MEDRIKEIISNEHNINVDKIRSVEGGYRSDETYLIESFDQSKYIVKYITYKSSDEYLQSILKFENVLHDLYKYPCPKIILSNKEEYLTNDKKFNRLFFVETYIQGIEPTNEILNKENYDYLYRMGSLLAKWRIASQEYSFQNQNEGDQQLTDQWWEKQNLDNIDPFLLQNLIECKKMLINLHGNFPSGLIHNDFHPNNSLITNDQQIFIIDFIDACQDLFISDLATSIFHLLIHSEYGIDRVKAFFQGYEQIIALTQEERNILDIFVRFKLTLSLIEDLENNNNNRNDPFIESCFHLLHKLNHQPTLVKNLLI